MFSIAKLIEMETLQGRSLGQIRAELPRVYHRCQTIRCPWTAKGALMRHMVETHSADRIELTDGVKVCEPQSDNWVLVLPDAGEPVVHIFANGGDRDWVDRCFWIIEAGFRSLWNNNREVRIYLWMRSRLVSRRRNKVSWEAEDTMAQVWVNGSSPGCLESLSGCRKL